MFICSPYCRLLLTLHPQHGCEVNRRKGGTVKIDRVSVEGWEGGNTLGLLKDLTGLPSLSVALQITVERLALPH